MTTARSDMISILPDALLCHILSFLPTKLAASTSVLSKRWTPLWLSVPTIHLEEETYADDHQQRIHFLRTVCAVMLKRDIKQTLKSFSLTTDANSLCDSSDISTCVNAAIQRGVENLILDLVPSPRIKLPSGIIGTKTLVFLRLRGLTLNGVFSHGFPSLKVMRLEYICFQQHGHLMQLLSGCPILEDLHVEDLTLSNYDGLTTGGELYNLVRAVIFFAITVIPLKCLCNAKSLRIYEGLPNHEVACTFRNLTSLELLVDFYNWDWFLEVLQHCLKLQNLEIAKLDGAEDDDLGDHRWVEPQFVPECLSSHLRTFVLRNYQGFDSELHLAKYIMQNAKVLCTMRIGSGIFSNPQAKLEFIKKMSSFPWSSATCELHLIEGHTTYF